MQKTPPTGGVFALGDQPGNRTTRRGTTRTRVLSEQPVKAGRGGLHLPIASLPAAYAAFPAHDMQQNLSRWLFP